jgi:hypothetical protein
MPAMASAFSGRREDAGEHRLGLGVLLVLDARGAVAEVPLELLRLGCGVDRGLAVAGGGREDEGERDGERRTEQGAPPEAELSR